MCVVIGIVTVLMEPQHIEIRELLSQYAWVVWTVVAGIWAATGRRLFRQEGPTACAKWLGLSSLLLLPFFVPPVGQARELGKFARCRNNLAHIGQALGDYYRVHQSQPAQQTGEPPHSWRVDLLPFLALKPIYEKYQQHLPWDSPENTTIAKSEIFPYRCPSMAPEIDDQNRYFACYALLHGPHAVWTPTGPQQLTDIPDGASHTAIVVEACGQNIVWTEPRDIDIETTPVAINLPGGNPLHSPGIFSSMHQRGVHVLMADGSVRRIPLHTDPRVLRAMITADGGEKE